MTFSSKRIRALHSDLFYIGNKISEVSKHTHVGITLSSNLTWSVYQKATKRLGAGEMGTWGPTQSPDAGYG